MGKRKRRKTKTAAKLTHNFFSRPYHAVISSKSHLALPLLLRLCVLNRRPAIGPLPIRTPSHSLALPWLTEYLLAVSWVWVKTETLLISLGYLYISVHNAHTYTFNHVTASAYFHMCVLCSESLIDGLVKGQYATALLSWHVNHCGLFNARFAGSCYFSISFIFMLLIVYLFLFNLNISMIFAFFFICVFFFFILCLFKLSLSFFFSFF